MMQKRTYYSKDVHESAKESMRQIKEGLVRNHKLKDRVQIHSGEVQERECDLFCDFLMSKNYFLIANLRGCVI